MANAFGLAYLIDRLRQSSGTALALGAVALVAVLSIVGAMIAGLLQPGSEPVLLAPLRWS